MNEEEQIICNYIYKGWRSTLVIFLILLTLGQEQLHPWLPQEELQSTVTGFQDLCFDIHLQNKAYDHFQVGNLRSSPEVLPRNMNFICRIYRLIITLQTSSINFKIWREATMRAHTHTMNLVKSTSKLFSVPRVYVRCNEQYIQSFVLRKYITRLNPVVQLGKEYIHQ